jgi:hypothetical protein
VTDLGKVVTEVGFLLNESDQSILDLQEDCGTRFDLFAKSAVGRDRKLLTTKMNKPMFCDVASSNLRLGRIGV